MQDSDSFPRLLQCFFSDRLLAQRKVSPHTIASYRDTFRLLLQFARKRLHKAPSQLGLKDLNASLIGEFLNDLEKRRHNGARSRNLRLTAVPRLSPHRAANRTAIIRDDCTATPRRMARHWPTRSLSRQRSQGTVYSLGQVYGRGAQDLDWGTRQRRR